MDEIIELCIATLKRPLSAPDWHEIKADFGKAKSRPKIIAAFNKLLNLQSPIKNFKDKNIDQFIDLNAMNALKIAFKKFTNNVYASWNKIHRLTIDNQIANACGNEELLPITIALLPDNRTLLFKLEQITLILLTINEESTDSEFCFYLTNFYTGVNDKLFKNEPPLITEKTKPVIHYLQEQNAIEVIAEIKHFCEIHFDQLEKKIIEKNSTETYLLGFFSRNNTKEENISTLLEIHHPQFEFSSDSAIASLQQEYVLVYELYHSFFNPNRTPTEQLEGFVEKLKVIAGDKKPTLFINQLYKTTTALNPVKLFTSAVHFWKQPRSTYQTDAMLLLKSALPSLQADDKTLEQFRQMKI